MQIVGRPITDFESELLYMGRDYPKGYDYFRTRLHKAFSVKAGLSDETEIKQAIAQAEYVKQGQSALPTSRPC